VLISPASHVASKDYFQKVSEKIPMVFFDRDHDDIEGVKITTDDYESAYSATQHLIEAGCKRIGFLAALDTLTTGKKRMQGYIDASKDNGFAAEPELIVTQCENNEPCRSKIRDFIARQKPDGILSSIEELALPCYYVCKELNLNIPKDLKVITYSNLSHAELLNPSLSTINQPAFEIGTEAATILFKMFSKRWYDPNITISLKSNIIKRESTQA
jgi:LacI family transcriptional regulator